METLAGSRIDILGAQISNINPDLACEYIEKWINNHKKVYVCVANVATIVDCQKDLEYCDVINGADLVTPDGMPLVWIGRKRGGQRMRRTYGPDLMQELCNRGQNKNLRHYFYGGTEKTLGLLKGKLKEFYPQIQIAGSFAPPFCKKKTVESAEVIREINRTNPDILWIGLGSPKQDYWMYHHREQLDVPVMIGVGAAFDFIAGIKKQAPKWIQRCGLEWFFRLCTEPTRLWRRYLIGNPQFLYYLIRDKIKG